jgi:hypothetical protein
MGLRMQAAGVVVGAVGALGAAAALAASALLNGSKRMTVLDRGFMAAMGALLSMHGLPGTCSWHLLHRPPAASRGWK